MLSKNKANSMNANNFVDVLKVVVKDSSIEGTISILESPPGRRPLKELIDLSNFYNGLTEDNKKLINQIIECAVDNTLFGMLCVIDGVRAIENSDDKGELILTYKKGDSLSNILNKDKDLHDLYNSI